MATVHLIRPTTQAPTMPMRPYQCEGVAWVLEVLKRRRAAALCDDPGLGKTLQALRVADGLQARRILVIGPAIARGSWEIEVRKFAPERAAHLHIVQPDALPGSVPLAAPDLMLVFAYDQFSRPGVNKRWVRALSSHAWDLLVLDEAHYLKNDSARTKMVYGEQGTDTGLQASCARVLLLTGTITPNHAGELWQHYRTFWPELIHTKGVNSHTLELHEWQERYTEFEDTLYGRQVRGSKGQAELRDRLAPVLLRRRRRDVLPELPPLQIEDTPLVVDAGTRARLGIEVEAKMSLDNPLLDDESLSRARRVLGELKVWPAASWATERLGLGEGKLLLFAWHRSVIQKLTEFLVEFQPVVVTGSTPPAERNLSVSRFQADPKCRVFVGQMLAAGTAITLTAAHHVGIVEASWVPGENEQAIARAHRMGQANPVLASFLYLPGTLDETIMRTFRRKAQETLALLPETPMPLQDE
jgi:SWI/SNF-related matrix-associated actin-dependent regulator 1 of chromatin subfamily A